MAALQGVTGTQPGLYGGTQNSSACDADQLTSFLAENPDKAAAWGSVIGVPVTDIGTYVGDLTPVLLRQDTRVTNHGFKAGKATPRQAVLQAGTAVMVDAFGVPRVRCACGNPLAPPTAAATGVKYSGQPWEGFEPARARVVVPASSKANEFTLVDVGTGERFTRTAGTAGSDDVPITTTTTTPPQPTVVTAEGQVGASSTFSGFPAGLGVDGDPSTSWFSRGAADGPGSTYTWTGTRDEVITLVRILGNGANRRPDFRRGFGFHLVTITVFTSDNRQVWSETFQLPGSPDPTIEARPGVSGQKVVLAFRGHENAECGGFAELTIGASR